MYTYIKSIGNHIYTTGYDSKGRKFYSHDKKFKPYLYLSTSKHSDVVKFPEMTPASKMQFESIMDMRFNSKQYPQEMIHGKVHDVELIQKIRQDRLADNFDPQNIRVMFYDIEVFSEKGFPSAFLAEHPVVSISAVIRGDSRAFLWYLSRDFEFSRYHWFKSIYPELKSVADNKLEQAVPVFKEKSIQAIHRKIADLRADIKKMKADFSSSEELQVQHHHWVFYVQETEKKIENLENHEKRILRIEKNLDRMKRMDIRRFDEEEDLLADFLKFKHDENIDVVSGWNSLEFDDPYVMNRATKLLGEDEVRKFSPFSRTTETEVTFKDKTRKSYDTLAGFQYLDYMRLDKKYKQNKRDSYKLEDVSQDVNGFGKVSFEGSLADLWKTDKQKYLEYNIGDSECLEGLDNNLGYIDLLYSICHYAGVNPEVYEHPTYIWEGKLFNDMLDKGMIIPSSGSGNRNSKAIEGAYVKEPQRGMFGWIMSVDLTSLYPSIIRMMNMSHEMILRKENINVLEETIAGTFDYSKYKNKNECVSPFGLVFSKDRKGFITEIIENLFVQRKEHKNLYKKYEKMSEKETDISKKTEYLRKAGIFNGLQNAEKVLLNSYYGALQVASFALYNRDYAESITTIGQIANRYCQRELNEWLNKMFKTDKDYVIAGDTDSLILSVDCFVDSLKEEKSDEEIVDFLDNIGKKLIEPKLKEIYKKMTDYMGVFENTMNMDREVIGKGGFWKAKKKYAILVYDMEGTRYTIPKMKIMGIQIVRSDTPTVVKPILKDFIKRLLYGCPIASYIAEKKKKVMNMTPEEFAKPMGTSVYADYYEPSIEGLEAYRKGTPYIIKGAVRYNRLLEQLGLTDKYEKIGVGDKVKFCYLDISNPYSIEGISFLDELPEEFGLHEYIKRDIQYYKICGKFFEDMLEVIGKSADIDGNEGIELF